MAVNKASLMAPLVEAELDITPKAMVVGGGISGMAAARSLAARATKPTSSRKAIASAAKP